MRIIIIIHRKAAPIQGKDSKLLKSLVTCEERRHD